MRTDTPADSDLRLADAATCGDGATTSPGPSYGPSAKARMLERGNARAGHILGTLGNHTDTLFHGCEREVDTGHPEANGDYRCARHASATSRWLGGETGTLLPHPPVVHKVLPVVPKQGTFTKRAEMTTSAMAPTTLRKRTPTTTKRISRNPAGAISSHGESCQRTSPHRFDHQRNSSFMTNLNRACDERRQVTNCAVMRGTSL